MGAATERPTRAVLAAGDTAGLAAFVDGLELSDDMTGPPDYKRSVLRAHLQRVTGSGGCDRPVRLQALGVAGLPTAHSGSDGMTGPPDYRRSVLRVHVQRMLGVQL